MVKTVTPDPVTGKYSVSGEQIEGGGYVRTYGYDYLSNQTNVKDSLGRDSVFAYDLLNRITSLTEPGPTLGTTFVSTFVYSEEVAGWNVKVTNPANEVVTTQLDQLGRVIDVSGNTPTAKASYWLDGSLKSTTDELGKVTDFSYDNRGRMTSVIAPPDVLGGMRSTTNYIYNVGNDDLVDSIADPLGRSTAFVYDPGGRLKQLTQPDPDGAGTLLAAWTIYTRDSLGSVTKSIDRFSQANLVTARDAWFRTLSTSDPAGATTSYQYDVFGNTTKVTDPLNNITDYSFNKINQLVTETQVGVGSRSFFYDAEGNTRKLTDRNSRFTIWGYDNRNRVTSETWSSIGGGIFYNYDSADRLTGVDDTRLNGPDFTFTYDARGQLQNELQSHPLMAKTVAFDRDYSAIGMQTKLAANIGGSLTSGEISGGLWDFVNTYAYDGMNRMTSVTQATVAGGNAVSPKLASFAYDAASQLTDLRRYSATTASTPSLEVHSRMSYDLAGQLKSITHGKTEIASGENWAGTSAVPASLGTGSMLAGYFLNYDRDNRVTSLASWRDAFRTTYTYDGATNGTGTNSTDQLASATSAVIAGMTLPFPLPASETYNLDANGNRKATPGASQSTPGTHNRLQTDGTYNYEYDNEGNTTKRTAIVGGQVTEYTWDHRNRLTLVTDKNSSGVITQKVLYIYDAFNQRTGKRVDLDGNGTWDRHEIFAWADGQEVLRFVDSDGQLTTQPARIANRYLWGPAVDELLADEQFTIGAGPSVNATSASATEGNTLWALTDHLGSVRDLVDNNGVVRQHLVFDSFGRRVREVDYSTTGAVIASTDPAAVDELFGYTGRDWDIHTGLQYNRARWYDPNTGRWLSQDPIGFGGGDANLYRAMRNGPTNATDPSGLIEVIVVVPRGKNRVEERPESSTQEVPLSIGAAPERTYTLQDIRRLALLEIEFQIYLARKQNRDTTCLQAQYINLANSPNAPPSLVNSYLGPNGTIYEMFSFGSGGRVILSRTQPRLSPRSPSVPTAPLNPSQRAPIHQAPKGPMGRGQIDTLVDGLPAGRSRGVRTAGSQAELDKLFGELSQGGTKKVSGYPGDLIELPCGTTIGRRIGSMSGGPTIDITYPDGTVRKVHIDPWP